MEVWGVRFSTKKHNWTIHTEIAHADAGSEMPSAPSEEMVSLTYAVQRGTDGFGFDVSAASEVVALVPGGRADQDGLMRPGDQVTAIDGVLLRGRAMASMIRSVSQAFELTVDRHDPATVQQLTTLELPREGVSYQLLKVRWPYRNYIYIYIYRHCGPPL